MSAPGTRGAGIGGIGGPDKQAGWWSSPTPQRDGIVALLLVLGMAMLLIVARGIPDSPYEPMGPRFLAEIVPGILLILALFMGLRSLFGRKAATRAVAGTIQGDATRPHRPGVLRAASVLALVVVYAAVLTEDLVGYQAATLGFLWTAGLALAPRWNLRSLALIGLGGVIATTAVWLLLTQVLEAIPP